jgi:hypothetical protein
LWGTLSVVIVSLMMMRCQDMRSQSFLVMIAGRSAGRSRACLFVRVQAYIENSLAWRRNETTCLSRFMVHS